MPWILMGDWNCILSTKNRFGGAPLTQNDILPLNQTVYKSGLIECPSHGLYYTWNNKARKGQRTLSKLDRIFIN